MPNPILIADEPKKLTVEDEHGALTLDGVPVVLSEVDTETLEDWLGQWMALSSMDKEATPLQKQAYNAVIANIIAELQLRGALPVVASN